jgi:hypothetical protein
MTDKTAKRASVLLRNSCATSCGEACCRAANAPAVDVRSQTNLCSKLGKRGIDFIDSRRRAGPSGFAQHFVSSQLQTVLPFGCRKDVRDATVEFRFRGTHVPEKLG